MGNADTVRAFLSDKRGLWFCDSCISEATGIKPVNQVNQLTRPLVFPGSPFSRAEGVSCSECGKPRTCIKG